MSSPTLVLTGSNTLLNCRGNLGSPWAQKYNHQQCGAMKALASMPTQGETGDGLAVIVTTDEDTPRVPIGSWAGYAGGPVSATCLGCICSGPDNARPRSETRQGWQGPEGCVLDSLDNVSSASGTPAGWGSSQQALLLSPPSLHRGEENFPDLALSLCPWSAGKPIAQAPAWL